MSDDIRVCVTALRSDGSMRIVREIPGAMHSDGTWVAQVPDFLRNGEVYVACKGDKYRMMFGLDHMDSHGYDQEFIHAVGVGRILPEKG